jgi:hypothetical protein
MNHNFIIHKLSGDIAIEKWSVVDLPLGNGDSPIFSHNYLGLPEGKSNHPRASQSRAISQLGHDAPLVLYSSEDSLSDSTSDSMPGTKGVAKVDFGASAVLAEHPDTISIHIMSISIVGILWHPGILASWHLAYLNWSE